MPVRIPLSQKLEAQIDEIDVPLVAQYSWRIMEDKYTSYAARSSKSLAGPRTTLYMHREIYVRAHGKLSPGERVSHIDGDGLNNCRANLELKKCKKLRSKR